LGCEELSRKTSLVDISAFDINSILRGCHLYCVNDCHANTYIQNIVKNDALPKYDRTNMCFDLINEREKSSQVSSIVSNNKPGYVEKLPFKPLPPKEGKMKKKKKKKKKKRSKKREETVSSPKHVAPIIVVADESELDDEPMPITYISDHDWEKHTTFDIENLFGTNSENDDVNNCYTISTIHVSSNDDIESSKLGEEVFENPFATDDYIFETSPSSKNYDMFTNEHTLEDNYSIVDDDIMPPVFDNYHEEYYDIGYNYNHPHETCHSYGGITQNHPFNMQLVYHVRVLNDDPAPIVINEKNFSYDTFMHMDHDKNVSCDGYIVDFINDATESFYERGKHGYMHLNNIKFPSLC
jgi:hypothetical protein